MLMAIQQAPERFVPSRRIVDIFVRAWVAHQAITLNISSFAQVARVFNRNELVCEKVSKPASTIRNLCSTPSPLTLRPAPLTLHAILMTWQRRLTNLRSNRESRIDHIRDVIFQCLPHESLRAAFGEAIVRH